jgi:hypothetical protein
MCTDFDHPIAEDANDIRRTARALGEHNPR